MVFEISYSGTYIPYNIRYQMAYPEFVLVHSIFHSEWVHRSAILLVKLLGMSLQMDLDSNDAAVRTVINLQEGYVAVNTIHALAIGDGPAVIPAVNDL
jgi:hypothetical protein